MSIILVVFSYTQQLLAATKKFMVDPITLLVLTHRSNLEGPILLSRTKTLGLFGWIMSGIVFEKRLRLEE